MIPRFASLPPFCVKCGAAATVPWRHKFYWHPPLLALLIIVNLLLYAIVALVVRKKLELNVPLCETHHVERKHKKLTAALMLLGCVPLGTVAGMLFSDAFGWATGVAMFIAGVVFLFTRNLGFGPKKIDENGGVFRGACAEFLNLLPEQQS